MKLIMIMAIQALIQFPANDRRPALEVRSINEIEVQSSWELLTDKATITLPRKRDFSDEELGYYFQAGDPVSIHWGYNGEMTEEFTGYVAEVEPSIPIVLSCEDEMWKLKREFVSFSYKSVSLSTLLNKIAPGYSIDAVDVQLGAFRTNHSVTAAKVLQKLKDSYNLYSFFRDGTLVCGKIHQGDNQVKFGFQNNIAKSSLTFKRNQDVLVKVTATSFNAKGENLEVTVGDDNGDEHQLSYYNIDSEATLKKLAEDDLSRLKYEGYRGTFTGFGIPRVKHGDVVELINHFYPERGGEYFADGVTKKVDIEQAAISQEIKLGPNAG